ncbi:MAG: hypothetical protein HYY84_06175 [Deltaproteobacteria bacterium]|nr:hypothetical protein [Deltaproteobacteria bacterium]
MANKTGRLGKCAGRLPLVALALLACVTKRVDSSNTVTVTFNLPAGMSPATVSKIGRVEIYLDEPGGASLFGAETQLALGTTQEGVPYEAQFADIDGDKKNEFYLRFRQNPFGLARTWTISFAGGGQTASTFLIRGRIWSGDGVALLATAVATADRNGEAIQFGPTERAVALDFGCEPTVSCLWSADAGQTTDAVGTLVANFALPPDMSQLVASQLNYMDLYFDEPETTALFSADSVAETGYTTDGIAYERQVTDVDGDGRREYYVRLLSNPFAVSANWQSWSMNFTGSASVGVFLVRARLWYGTPNTLIATVTASVDSTGGPIQFGFDQRTVTLPFTCASPILCGGSSSGDAGASSDGGAPVDAGSLSDAGAPVCNLDSECGIGKYCRLTEPRGCAPCSATETAHCGTASSSPGCVPCSGATPACIGGVCGCTEHAACGQGQFCEAVPPFDAGSGGGAEEATGCVDGPLGSILGVVASGSTATADAGYSGSCGGGAARDRAFGWVAPATGQYIVDTIGSNFDTILTMRDGGCDGPQIACNDDLAYGNTRSKLTVNLLAGQSVGIIVDGYSSASGSFALNIALDGGLPDAGPAAPEIGACAACSATNSLRCGSATTDAGCKTCLGETPSCVDGECRCTAHASCGAGQYCTNLDGGVCASCSLTDALHCGSGSAPAGCSVCTGVQSTCVNGSCACTSHESCGTGKYCTNVDGGVCASCSSTNANFCGTGASPPGCSQCANPLPSCVSGACACTSHAQCGVGKYCTNLSGGTCGDCNPSSAPICGTSASPAGCTPCSGATPACSGGACVCSGERETDSCFAAASLVCVGGACSACTSTGQCPSGYCCRPSTDRCEETLYSWTGIAPPGVRTGHSAIFDAANQRMIVFGGGGETANFQNDVWSLSLAGGPSVWTPLVTTNAPPSGRAYHTAVYDAANQRMIVFGGRSNASSYLDETWALSLAATGPYTWTSLSAASIARRHHSAIVDTANGRMVVFGGESSSSSGGCNGARCNDTLAFSFSSNAWSALSTTGTPSPRARQSAVYDVTYARMVVFGGETASAIVQEVYELTLASGVWRLLPQDGTAPSARRSPSAIFDAPRQRMIVFGGGFNTGPWYWNTTWELTLPNPASEPGTKATWTLLSPGGAPAARYNSSAIVDTVNNKMVVFAGMGSTDYNDAHALDLPTPSWTQLAPLPNTTPVGRDSHSAIYDITNGRVVIFGGDSETGYRNDTWALAMSADGGANWSNLLPAGTPPSARERLSAIFDKPNGRMIVFGGYGSGGNTNNTYALSLPDAGTATWSTLSPSGTLPSARSGHTAIYDDHVSPPRIVVFGGYTGGSPDRSNEVFYLSLPGGTPAWSKKYPTGTTPIERDAHTAIYDSANKRMIVFGGSAGGSIGRNDVWALALPNDYPSEPAWSEISPTGTKPNKRYGQSATYDAVNQRMLVFGGKDTDIGQTTNEVWALTLPDAGTPEWQQLSTTGVVPDRRSFSTAVLETVGHRLVVFGGYGPQPPRYYRADAWFLERESCKP